jgi:hypothetical protein
MHQTILVDVSGARDVTWGGWQSVNLRRERDASRLSEGDEPCDG